MDVNELARAAASVDDVAWKKRYPEPALVFVGSFAKLDKQKVDTLYGRTKQQLDAEAGSITEARVIEDERERKTDVSGAAPTPAFSELLGKSKVVFVAKTGRNPFANMITVGRAANNDIDLNLQTITKFHAYFMRAADGTWQIHDQKSTNGTFVDERRLEAGATAVLQDGARISFGPDVHAKFFTPEGLYGFLALYRSGVASA